MRKALKILLVFLILAVIIGGSYVYFFLFAPDTTSSILIYWGNRAMRGEHYGTAVQLFEWAYELDPSNADLALSLATSYSGAENYTKAEYVLLSTIEKTPDEAELYRSLSRVFVAQDKLLDAQQLLDQLPAGPVAETLKAQRPAAPSFSLEGGYYSDYIELAVTAPTGSVYVSLDDQYPSVESGVFAGVTLPGGTTSVSAVAVGDNGLVSPLSRAEYTITGVVEEVAFADRALDAHIRELLYKSPTQKIMTNELWTLTKLTVPETVTALEDLQYFVGLTDLTISRLPTTADLSVLSKMPDLQTLHLDGCAVTTEQLSAISQCSSLRALYLSDCGLSTLRPLSSLTALEILDVSDNFISDLLPLQSCTALQELNLYSNAISDVAPLGALTQLRVLNLASNALPSASALSACTTLEELDLSGNRLTSIDCIGSMPKLRSLSAAKNQLSEISAIAACTTLERLDVSDNVLESIDGLENILTLEYININYNDVKKLPDFSTSCSLQQFYAAHNFLEDITGLSNLPQLNYVDVDYNNVSSIDCLLTCPAIVQINAFGTNVSDTSAFDGTSVIVNYNPA